MFTPSAIEYFNPPLLDHVLHMLLGILILVSPPHHEKINAINGKRSIIFLSDCRRYEIVNCIDSFLPVLIDSPHPSQVIMRMRYHMYMILLKPLLCFDSLIPQYFIRRVVLIGVDMMILVTVIEGMAKHRYDQH